jgi:hypothetical protein
MRTSLLEHLESSRDEIGPMRSQLQVGRNVVPSLVEQVETQVREATHGSIRGLDVREDRGRIRIRGQAPSQYARQLALCGALQFLSGEQLRAEITVR